MIHRCYSKLVFFCGGAPLIHWLGMQFLHTWRLSRRTPTSPTLRRTPFQPAASRTDCEILYKIRTRPLGEGLRAVEIAATFGSSQRFVAHIAPTNAGNTEAPAESSPRTPMGCRGNVKGLRPRYEPPPVALANISAAFGEAFLSLKTKQIRQS